MYSWQHLRALFNAGSSAFFQHYHYDHLTRAVLIQEFVFITGHMINVVLPPMFLG